MAEVNRIPRDNQMEKMKKCKSLKGPPLKINKPSLSMCSDGSASASPDLPVTNDAHTVKRCLFTEDPLPKTQKQQVFSKPRQCVTRVTRSTKASPTQRIGTSSMSVATVSTPELECIRFLIHNTSSYAIKSLLCFVNEGKSVEDYHNSILCRQVFGPVSLSFLEQVWQHRVVTMSYRRKLGMYPHIGKRVDKCLACQEKVEDANVHV